MSDYFVVDLDTGSYGGTNLVAVEPNDDVEYMSDNELIAFATVFGKPIDILAGITGPLMRSPSHNRKATIMDIDTTPTTDIVISDEAVVVEDYTNPSFGKEIAKTLIVSAASTAGMMIGMAAIGFTVTKVSEFKTRRASKKNTVVEEVAETVKDATNTEN